MRVEKNIRAFRRTLLAWNLFLWPCIAFLAGEVFVRATAAPDAKRNAIIETNRRATAVLTEGSLPSLWETYGERYRTNAFLDEEIAGERYQISINERGFRGGPVKIPKPPGVFRIVCVGGSTTVEGRTDQTTYPALLEKRLRERLGTDRVEVVNCGVSVYGSRRELRRLPDYLALQPDMLVEYNAVNDVCFQILREKAKAAAPWQKIARQSALLFRVLGSRLRSEDIDMEELFERRTFRHLRGIVGGCREAGVEVAFCSFAYPSEAVITTDEYCYYDFNLRGVWRAKYSSLSEYSQLIRMYNRKLRELCRAENVIYVPVARNMREGAAAFIDICHMTPRGIERKAEVIAYYLSDHVARRLAEEPAAKRPALSDTGSPGGDCDLPGDDSTARDAPPFD